MPTNLIFCEKCRHQMAVVQSSPRGNLSPFNNQEIMCPRCGVIEMRVVDRWTGEEANTAGESAER